MQTTRMSGLSFSCDEQELLVTCNLSGVPNAWKVRVTGGPLSQLTFSSNEPIRAQSFFPHDGRIVYMQDKGGIENRHLCVLEEDGTQVAMTQGERVKSGFYGWRADGKYFYCTTDERVENQFDVYRVDAYSYERSLIFRNEDEYLLAAVSPDERYLALVKYNGFSDSDLYVYSLRARTLHLVTPHTGDIYYLPIYFEQNSRFLQYRTSEDEGAASVYRYDLHTGVHELVAKWLGQVRGISVSENGRYRAALLDEREATTIQLYDYSANTLVTLESMPAGNVTAVALSKSERLMAFYVSGDRRPNEIFVYDLPSGQIRQLTSNLNPEIDPGDLVESEVVTFTSFDELEIPCLLWIPHNASASNKAPGLIWVHGGPVGQIRKAYAGAVQFLVNHGYVVLGVNHRGSTGYGKDFMNGADRKQGREPLWDCIEAKRYLATLDCVDSSRIGIIGGSFGGYMAFAALTFHPHEFSVGVSISGISNLRRHVEAKMGDPHLSKIYLQKVGHPHIDRGMLEALSPALHAHNVVSPLMVVHGAKDPRADKAESIDMVNAVRANGGVAEYLEFADEAHGFRQRSNSIRAYDAILNFLEKYLKNSSVTETIGRVLV